MLMGAPGVASDQKIGKSTRWDFKGKRGAM
jgi:hypothetical protein